MGIESSVAEGFLDGSKGLFTYTQAVALHPQAWQAIYVWNWPVRTRDEKEKVEHAGTKLQSQ